MSETGSTPKNTAGDRRHLPWQDKVLIAIGAVLTVLGIVAGTYNSLVARPELPAERTAEAVQPGETQTGPKEQLPKPVDYGEGIRPVASGERKSESFYTVLILGRDTGGGGNTDTMLLASYDVTNQKATVMSIPRDTMVNVDWDVKKINSVYVVNGEGDEGIRAVYKEVAQLVGFEPDYQVVVEWEAVGAIVDAIGGVYFDVPYNMDYHDPYQDLVIEQEAGYRLLTGDDAMQVIRWRKNDPWSPHGYSGGVGDSGRMAIQQDFIKAVIAQMMQPANIKNIGAISKVFEENVTTDLSFQNILWFGVQAFSGGLKLSDVEFLTMPWRGANVFSRTYSKQLGRAVYLAYVTPVAKELLQIVNEKLSPFRKEFTLKDLDIMSVRADGSLTSTTGKVEDTVAARAPDLSRYEKPGEKTESDYTLDEHGNLVDPSTGEVVETPPPGEDQDPVTEVPPDTPSGEDPPDPGPADQPTDTPPSDDPTGSGGTNEPGSGEETQSPPDGGGNEPGPEPAPEPAPAPEDNNEETTPAE